MDRSSGYNNTVLKQNNRSLVFKLIATNDGISRTELADACNLTKMAVSYIVSDFLERGFLTESEYTGDRYFARRPVMLKLSSKSPKVVGLVIHRTHVAAVLCDCQLNILKSETIKLKEYDFEALIESAFRVTDAVMAGQPVIGIGIGSIGPVDIGRGVILNPPHFHGIRDVAIVELFEKRYGIPAYLDYHYNCVALAEKYFGSGKEYQNFLFLGITEGLGAGIVIGDRLFSNYTSFSGEIGHISIDSNGPLCECGNHGCLGMLVDFSTEESVQQSMEYLSIGLSGLCNLLNPQAIIVGDELARLQDDHLGLLEDKLNEKLVAKDYRHIDVCRAYRTRDLEASSCAINVVERLFSGELVF